MKILCWVLILLCVSCKTEYEPMDAWETGMSEFLEADRIELTQNTVSHTVNGVPEETERFIEMDIYDSKQLKRIVHNKRLLDKKCSEIKDSVLSYLHTVELEDYDELRIQIIEDYGFLMFKSSKQQTVTLRM